MTTHLDLMKAVRDDARRAGERDRLLLEARRACTARRERPDPAALGKRVARLLFRRATAAPRSVQASSEQTGQGRLHPSQSRQ